MPSKLPLTRLSLNKYNGFTGPTYKIDNVFRITYGFTAWEGGGYTCARREAPSFARTRSALLRNFARNSALLLIIARYVGIALGIASSHKLTQRIKSQNQKSKTRKAVRIFFVPGISGFFRVSYSPLCPPRFPYDTRSRLPCFL
jgi:hypothetical protein